MAEWFDRAFERHRATYGGPGPFPAALLDRAEAIARHLLASAPREVLLHGDFHHYNVLSADRAPWLAIDPKGMLGDPGYEIGPFLLNPDGPPKSAALLRRRLDVLAEALAYDRALAEGVGLRPRGAFVLLDRRGLRGRLARRTDHGPDSDRPVNGDRRHAA